MPRTTAVLSLLFAAIAVASPEPLVNRNGAVNCNAVNSIVTIMREQAVATPFCSSYLGIKTVTSTSTVTSTPCDVTSTVSTSSVSTSTSTATSTVSAVTTVYPVVAISTTSTCGLGQTVVQSSSSNVNVKRATTTKCTTTASIPPSPKSIPLGTPTCLTKFKQTEVSSACSCLSIPTPTKVTVTTTTLSTKTVTKTVASTAVTTVTTTTTSTTFTSTYSATQYYTSTFTVLPSPSQTITPPANPSESFGEYDSLDFSGQDIKSFFCYQGGPAPPDQYANTTCVSFADCVNECAYYNANGFGASSNTTCGAVVYNAPADGSSGYCYLKTTVYGCGGPNANTKTGVILPLVATDPQ